MILTTSIEHGVATVAHDILVGARAVEKVLTIVQKDAPQIEAITSLIDPRAAAIERIGAALLGELQPQVDKALQAGTTMATDASAPSFTVSLELVTELKALYASMASEISGVKATIATTKAA